MLKNKRIIVISVIALLTLSPALFLNVEGASASATKYKCLGPLNCAGGYVANVPSGLNASIINFIVPTLNCTATPNGIFNFVSLLSNTSYPWSENTAFWSGISLACSNGSPSYALLMNPSSSRGFTPNPGDVIRASVSYSDGAIHDMVKDFTTKQRAAGSESVSGWTPVAAQCGGGSTGSQSNILIDFGAIQVKACKVTVNGITEGIGFLSNVYKVYIYRSNGKRLLAYPSKLFSHKAFTLYWVASS